MAAHRVLFISPCIVGEVASCSVPAQPGWIGVETPGRHQARQQHPTRPVYQVIGAKR